MNLQQNILTGSLTQAVKEQRTQRLPAQFQTRDFSLSRHMLDNSFDYARLHDVENKIIKKAQQMGIMRSSHTNLRAPTPLSATSSKAALLKKTQRASSARFRVQR